MTTAVDTTIRCYVVLTGGGQMLHCIDSYGEVLARVTGSREAMLRMSESGMDNPMALPLVNVRMLAAIPEADPVVVDACFNPLHLLMMYRAHPDV